LLEGDQISSGEVAGGVEVPSKTRDGDIWHPKGDGGWTSLLP